MPDAPIEEIPKQNKTYLKPLQILNSAKNEEERYYYEVLKIAQKGLNIGINS